MAGEDAGLRYVGSGITRSVVHGTDGDSLYEGKVDIDGFQYVKNYVKDPDTLDWVAGMQPIIKTDEINVLMEDNMSQVVYEDGTVLYVCRAPIGSSLGSAAWQIKQVETADPIRTKWADGNASYDNVATDLNTVKALSYS